MQWGHNSLKLLQWAIRKSPAYIQYILPMPSSTNNFNYTISKQVLENRIRKLKYLTQNQCCQWSNIPTFSRHLQILLCVANVSSNWFWLLVTQTSESLFEVSSWHCSHSSINIQFQAGQSSAELCLIYYRLCSKSLRASLLSTAHICFLRRRLNWNGTLFHINRSLCETLHFPLKEINLFL